MAGYLIDDSAGSTQTAITDLFVAIVTHGPGDESIAGYDSMPLVTSSPELVKRLSVYTDAMTRQTGKPVTWRHFHLVGDL